MSKGMRRYASNLVRYKGPTKVSGDTVLNAAAGATSLLRVFDVSKQQHLRAATTRLRTDVAASVDIWLIPHIVPAWIEAGDTVTIITDTGVRHETSITSLVAGTDEDTPATNFDTVTVGTAATTPCSEGNGITLLTKGTTGVIYPVEVLQTGFAQADAVEIETNTPGTLHGTTVSLVQKTKSTEDGEIAPEQPERTVLTLALASTVAVSVRRRLRRKIGGDITMAEYGVTPHVAGADDWGWEGTISDSLVGLEEGDLLQLEIHFNGGAGLIDIESLVEPVVEA